jgi:hypothetical protein
MLAPTSAKMICGAMNLGAFVGYDSLKDGAPVATWNGHSNGFNTRYDWTAAGTARPTLKLGRVNGRPALSFNGSTNRMDLSTTSGNIITSAAFQFWMVFRVRSVATNAVNPYDNVCLLTESNTQFGIFLKNNAGVYTLNAWTMDGAYKVPATPKSITLNTWYLVRWRLQGGTAYLSLNTTFGTSETSVVSGNLFSTVGTPRIGANYNATQFLDGDIAEFQAFNAGDLSANGPWSFATPGGSLEWENFENLSREYGLGI